MVIRSGLLTRYYGRISATIRSLVLCSPISEPNNVKIWWPTIAPLRAEFAILDQQNGDSDTDLSKFILHKVLPF